MRIPRKIDDRLKDAIVNVQFQFGLPGNALDILGKIVRFLLSRGVDLDKISVISTPDHSILIAGKSNEKNSTSKHISTE